MRPQHVYRGEEDGGEEGDEGVTAEDKYECGVQDVVEDADAGASPAGEAATDAAQVSHGAAEAGGDRLVVDEGDLDVCAHLGRDQQLFVGVGGLLLLDDGGGGRRLDHSQ